MPQFSVNQYLPQGSFLPNHLRISKIISQFSNKQHADFVKGNPLIEPLLDKNALNFRAEKTIIGDLPNRLSHAKYILIDEPFNGIAPIHKEAIEELIREQSKINGFIVTDHDYRNILDLATRIVLLHEGAIKYFKKRRRTMALGVCSSSFKTLKAIAILLLNLERVAKSNKSKPLPDGICT